MKASPLAKKLADKRHIDLQTLKGTGPHGKIMARDVSAPAAKPANKPSAHVPVRKVCTIPESAMPHAEIEGEFYHFKLEANMAYLAAISTPIAVQCENLLGGRYCLFDYVVRSSVKACLSQAVWLGEREDFDMLLTLKKGTQYVLVEHAKKKTIYPLAKQRREVEATDDTTPPNHETQLMVCDAGTTLDIQREKLNTLPSTIVIIGGTSPKTGIEAGRPVSKLILPVSLYINTKLMPSEVASHIAAEFRTLLENPVLLLL